MAPGLSTPRTPGLRARLRYQLLPLLGIVCLAGVGATLLSVRRAAEDALARARVQAEARWARLEARPETAAERRIRTWGADRDVHALHVDEVGRVLVGTDHGAFRWDPATGATEELPVPRGVAASGVRAVARLGDGVALGLEDGGVAWLHGRRDLAIPPESDGGRVRSLAPYAGGLAVGTAQGGLWWLGPAGGSVAGLPGEGQVPSEVRAMAASAGQLLLAGADGELVWLRGDARERAAVRGETPLAATVAGERAWVGTELGLWLWEPGRPLLRVEVGAVVTSLVADEAGAWVGSADGRVLRVLEDGALRLVTQQEGPVRALARVRGDLLVGGPFGLVELGPTGGEVARLAPRGLSSGHVTALAPGEGSRLWVGTFHGGLELLDPGGGAVLQRHHEPDLRQVNALIPALEAHPHPGLLVATSRGLFTPDGAGSFRRVSMGEAEASSPRYQAVVRHGEGLAVAGKDGVRLRAASGELRALGSFHGLPSNKAYALASRGEQLLVGTLGGLARIDDGRLARTWRPESSGLPAGWVQALGVAPTGVFMGTFGGGAAWMPDGELAVRAVRGSPPDVSPGALAIHGHRVLIGSAGAGVVVLDTRGRLRGLFQEGLPSLEVSALLPDAQGLWVGTSRGLARVPWEALETFLR